jgi:hypothetical protein
MRGDWATARHFCDHALALSPHWFWPLACRALLEFETGDFSQGEIFMERLLKEIDRTPQGPTAELAYAVMLPPLFGRITGVPGWFDIAEAAAKTLLTSPALTPRIAWDVNLRLALMAVARSDAAAMDQQYQALKPARGTALLQTSIDRILVS